MAQQFDAYRLSEQTMVVVLQSDIVDKFKSRLAATLVPVTKAGRVVRGLNPVIEISQQHYIPMPQLADPVRTSELMSSQPLRRAARRSSRVSVLISGISASTASETLPKVDLTAPNVQDRGVPMVWGIRDPRDFRVTRVLLSSRH